MERDPDIRMLAMRMNARQFPYIGFANPPVRTGRANEPIRAEGVVLDEAEPAIAAAPIAIETLAVPQAPAVTSGAALPEPVRAPVFEPALAHQAMSPQPAPAPLPVAAIQPTPPRHAAPAQVAPASFPLIRNAMQEARDLAAPPPRPAGGGSTADWLRARPAAAQV